MSLTTTFAGSRSSLYTDLAAFWRFNDPSNLSDAGPNGLTLNANGGPTYIPGLVGECVHLVAASNQYLNCPSSAPLQASPSDSLMVSAWVRHTTLQTLCGAVNKGSPTGGTGGEWGLEFIGSATNKWRFSLRNTADTSSFGVSSAVVCTTATWYHLLGWWDAVAKTINISVNGETPVTASFATGGFAGTNDINIGYWVSVSNRFNGDIDGVGVWRKAPIIQEIARLYNGGAGLEFPF